MARHICQPPADETGGRSEMMRLPGAIVANVNHLDAERGENVRDETPVTAPPKKFGAHHDGAKSACEHEEIVEADCELLSGDVIGIRPERRMAPPSVDRSRVRPTPAAELWDPVIENLGAGEVTLERVAGKLRKSTRPGKTSHVGHELDVVQHEQCTKLVARARGVTDGPNGEGHSQP
jgi:hypothetical protein